MQYPPIEEIVPYGHYSDELLSLVPLLMSFREDDRPKMRDFI